MKKEEIDLVVSILNAIVERAGYNVGEVGFGYDATGNLLMADGEDTVTGLEWVLEELLDEIRKDGND